MIDADVRTSVLGGRQMTQEELDRSISTIRYGTLSYVDEEGWPDMRPMNFGVYQGCYYFHAHKTKGEKLKSLTSGKRVCISFYKASDQVGQEPICQHESVLVYGRLERLDESDENTEEMLQGLTALCLAAGTPYKAAPERLASGVKTISVFKVIPEHTVGKLVRFATLPARPAPADSAPTP